MKKEYNKRLVSNGRNKGLKEPKEKKKRRKEEKEMRPNGPTDRK